MKDAGGSGAVVSHHHVLIVDPIALGLDCAGKRGVKFGKFKGACSPDGENTRQKGKADNDGKHHQASHGQSPFPFLASHCAIVFANDASAPMIENVTPQVESVEGNG